jgi:hypothetical protein
MAVLYCYNYTLRGLLHILIQNDGRQISYKLCTEATDQMQSSSLPDNLYAYVLAEKFEKISVVSRGAGLRHLPLFCMSAIEVLQLML